MKRIKMLLYGEPGVGKSVFASGAPNPYFVTTDGNYEFLEEFGAKEEAHTQVNSWNEAKALFASKAFDNYDTIVIDLLEDLFKWCEYEYCVKNRIDHLSDVGFGKGYETTRNEFFIEICKLLGLEKNIILLMHSSTSVVKDRRGVETTKYAPSSRIPDKTIDMIEGRVRYCLRCYLKDEEQSDGVLLKKRFLSLVPKPYEFGIIRGVNENAIPHDIPLDFKAFADCIGLNLNIPEKKVEPKKIEKVEKKIEKKEIVKEKPVKEELKQVEIAIPEKVEAQVENTETKLEDRAPWETPSEPAQEVKSVEETKQSEPVKPATTQVDNNDKLAAIRAKLAAINSNKLK